jgi:hypothetical protein
VREVVVVVVLALLATASAARAEFDATPLYDERGWSVEHTYSRQDGLSWCAAATRNAAGQTLDLTTYESGAAAVFVFDAAWSLEARPVRFSIDIDDSRWTLAGNARSFGLSALLEGAAGAFLRALRDGQAVAVVDARGAEVAAFSLEGSAEALGRLAECWERIRPVDRVTRAALQ